MKRFISFIIMLLILPMLLGGFVVFIYSFLGLERDFSQLYDKASSYAVGVIFGWLMWGAR